MPRQISEDRTRKEMIDPQLEQAGWYLRDHSKVKIEIAMSLPPMYLREEFAPCASLRGSSTGVMARAVVEPSRDIESLRGRMSKAGMAGQRVV